MQGVRVSGFVQTEDEQVGSAFSPLFWIIWFFGGREGLGNVETGAKGEGLAVSSACVCGFGGVNADWMNRMIQFEAR